MRALAFALAAPLLLLATSATAAPAKLNAKQQQQLDKSLAGLVPGKPRSCIPMRPSASLDHIGDGIFLFRVSARLIYRNDIAGGCPGGGINSTPVIKSPTGQYCRGDFVDMIDLPNGLRQGSCVLGDFTPYRAPGK